MMQTNKMKARRRNRNSSAPDPFRVAREADAPLSRRSSIPAGPSSSRSSSVDIDPSKKTPAVFGLPRSAKGGDRTSAPPSSRKAPKSTRASSPGLNHGASSASASGSASSASLADSAPLNRGSSVKPLTSNTALEDGKPRALSIEPAPTTLASGTSISESSAVAALGEASFIGPKKTRSPLLFVGAGIALIGASLLWIGARGGSAERVSERPAPPQHFDAQALAAQPEEPAPAVSQAAAEPPVVDEPAAAEEKGADSKKKKKTSKDKASVAKSAPASKTAKPGQPALTPTAEPAKPAFKFTFE